MKFLIINPQLLFNSKDKFTTGIIYLPIALASISSNLKKHNVNHTIIDLFGNDPKKISKLNNFFVLGENIEKYSDQVKSSDAIFVYANQVINHLSIINIIQKIRSINSSIKIFTFENTQAVTAYSLKDIYKKFIYSVNDFVLIGEPEEKINLICKNLNNFNKLQNINGLICKSFQNNKRDSDSGWKPGL